MPKPKSYLGDGVYAEMECGSVKLTTTDGLEYNIILLDPEVLHRFAEWLKWDIKEKK